MWSLILDLGYSALAVYPNWQAVIQLVEFEYGIGTKKAACE